MKSGNEAVTAGICPQYSWLHINPVCDRHKHERTKTRKNVILRGKLEEVTKKGLVEFVLLFIASANPMLKTFSNF